MSKNKNLQVAKSVKDDEFYTLRADVDAELVHYEDYFKDKVIYCPCDGPDSQFRAYFKDNFEKLGLRKLICTAFNPVGRGYEFIMCPGADGDQVCENENEMKFDGDFRGPECLDYMSEADVVVTNPPFSLWRAFFDQVVGFGLDYVLVGNMNAITYKNVFPYVKRNEMWLGANVRIKEFVNPAGEIKPFGNINWFTNINHGQFPEPLVLTKSYHADPSKYPKYDNYDAIEVSRVEDIPYDYDGEMGVPITYFEKHVPGQFEIIRERRGNDGRDLCVNGKDCYRRWIIRAMDYELVEGDRFYLAGERKYGRMVVKGSNGLEID